MNEKKQYAKVTELNGIPRLAEALPLALQHVVAMIVGCVTPAIILSGVTGLTPGDQVRLIQASLLISGLATLLQLFPPVRRCGSGLPVIMGASFAHVPLLIALGAQFGLPTILGAQLVGGVVAILVGLFYKKLSRIFYSSCNGNRCIYHRTFSVSYCYYLYGRRCRSFLISEAPETGFWLSSPLS